MKILAVAVATAAFLMATPRATAEPVEPEPTPFVLRLATGPGELRGPDGKIYAIPQDSRIVSPDAWFRIDAEFRRLQDQETRLKAENESFRKSVDSWSPGWVFITTTLVTGVALGWYLGSRD